MSPQEAARLTGHELGEQHTVRAASAHQTVICALTIAKSDYEHFGLRTLGYDAVCDALNIALGRTP